jgi:hypothetical protein
VISGRLEEAEELQRTELEVCARLQGAEHPATMASATNLAGILLSAGREGRGSGGGAKDGAWCAKAGFGDGAPVTYTLKGSKKYALISWGLGGLGRREEGGDEGNGRQDCPGVYMMIFRVGDSETEIVREMLRGWGIDRILRLAGLVYIVVFNAMNTGIVL